MIDEPTEQRASRGPCPRRQGVHRSEDTVTGGRLEDDPFLVRQEDLGPGVEIPPTDGRLTRLSIISLGVGVKALDESRREAEHAKEYASRGCERIIVSSSSLEQKI